MDKKETCKAAAFIVSIFVLYQALHDTDGTYTGIYMGCRAINRLCYMFYHANLLHAALNVWCMLSVVFIYDIPLWRFLFAYTVSLSIPPFCLSDIPTVGLSGVVYFLFGSISFEVRGRLYYQLWMSLYLIMGFILPGTNAWIHLYCYTVGVTIALLNKPLKIC